MTPPMGATRSGKVVGAWLLATVMGRRVYWSSVIARGSLLSLHAHRVVVIS